MTVTGTTSREAVVSPCALPLPRRPSDPASAASYPPLVVITAGPQPYPVPPAPRVDRSWAPDPFDVPLPLAVRPTAAVRRESRGLFSWLSTAVTALVVAVFLALAVGPQTGAYRTSTMLTGSMEPLLSPGDVLVLTPEPVGELAEGDVVAFNAPVEGRPVVTHRVVAVDRSGPRPVMITKGDANGAPDSWQAVVEGDVVWTVQGSVPQLGRAITLLRTPAAQLLLSRVLPLLLLLVLLVSVWRPARPEEPVTAAGGVPLVALPDGSVPAQWRDHPVWLDGPEPRRA